MTGRARVEAAVLAAAERLGEALEAIRGGAMTERTRECAICGRPIVSSGQGRPRRVCKGECERRSRQLYQRRYNAERVTMQGRGER